MTELEQRAFEGPVDTGETMSDSKQAPYRRLIIAEVRASFDKMTCFVANKLRCNRSSNILPPRRTTDLQDDDGLYAGGRLANIDVDVCDAVCDAVGELEQLTKAWLAHSEELVTRLKGRGRGDPQIVAGMVLKKLQTIRDLLQ